MPTQRSQWSLAWKESFMLLGDSPSRSWAECGLVMEPCLELLMHPESSGSASVVAVRPTKDISPWSSPALAQRTEAQGSPGWTPFLSQPSVPLQLGPRGKGLFWLHDLRRFAKCVSCH